MGGVFCGVPLIAFSNFLLANVNVGAKEFKSEIPVLSLSLPY
jgi:hypothetical protein